MLWAGFAIAGGIDLINGIHAFFPALPEIPVRKADLGIYFTEKPWNANRLDTRLYPLLRRGTCIFNAVGDVLFALVFLPVLER